MSLVKVTRTFPYMVTTRYNKAQLFQSLGETTPNMLEPYLKLEHINTGSYPHFVFTFMQYPNCPFYLVYRCYRDSMSDTRDKTKWVLIKKEKMTDLDSIDTSYATAQTLEEDEGAASSWTDTANVTKYLTIEFLVDEETGLLVLNPEFNTSFPIQKNAIILDKDALSNEPIIYFLRKDSNNMQCAYLNKPADTNTYYSYGIVTAAPSQKVLIGNTYFRNLTSSFEIAMISQNVKRIRSADFNTQSVNSPGGAKIKANGTAYYKVFRDVWVEIDEESEL